MLESSPTETAAKRLLIDGMNVIGSRPNRWWRDREAAMRDLVQALELYARARGEAVTVVLDAKPFPLGRSTEAAVEVVFASRAGPNAADDEIARIAEETSGEGSLTVVTSDRELAEHVRRAGAEVVSAGSFRRGLDRITRLQE
jgi:predicted RNA-binding protein with PIN domain